jgi:CBS domain containing-hemolysin-like protein
MITLILLIFVFLVLSAFFSGSEIAFVSSNKLGIEIKREEGTSRGRILGDFIDRPDDFLATMLVGNNIALVVFTILFSQLITPALQHVVSGEFILGFFITVISTCIVLVFGEFLPKTIFRLFANELLYFFALPLKLFKILLKAPTWLMLRLTNLFTGFFIKSPNEKLSEALTRTDLRHYVEETVSDFHEDIDKAIFTNFKETKLSRVLVTEGDIENVIGYVHHLHLLDNPKSIKKVILEIPFVPEAMNVRDLMMRFINERTNIACVVNEFGGTAGVITLEDILEEIFGEIEDEHDQEDYIERQISESEYLFSGRLEIDYLNENFPQLAFPEGEYHTLSGYLVMTSGRIPNQQGEVIELDGYRFVIERISDTKIELIRVKILPKTSLEEDIG